MADNGASFTLSTSAARAATLTTPAHRNTRWRGGHFAVRVTAASTGISLTPKIQARVPQSTGAWYDLLVGTAITSTGTTVLKVYPGVTPVANGAASDVLPSYYRVVVTAGSTKSATYSVGVDLVV